MSNIGKEFIKIPQGIKVMILHDNVVVEGNLGFIKKSLPKTILLIHKKDKIYFIPYSNLNTDLNNIKSPDWGTVRTMINNMIKGVNQGFNVKLQLIGIGYKTFLENNILSLKLGYSHIINYKIPEGIKITLLKPTLISISGIDIEFVTQVAAKIRSFRKPEPYKGKGIRYLNEIVLKKEGKKK